MAFDFSTLLRLQKASPLTPAEGDALFQELRDAANILDARLEVSLNADGSLKNLSIGTAAYQDRSIILAKLAFATAFYAVDTGTANNVTIAFTPAAAAHTDGVVLWVKVAATNTGATSLFLDALGAKPIKKNVSVDLDPGDIQIGQVILLVYDGTNYQLLLTTPAEAASETVINGSFENDSNGDGEPDGWIFDPLVLNGGSGTLVTADQIHGKKAFEFTVTAAEGGGKLTSAAFINVTPLTVFRVLWSQKSSDPGLWNKIEVEWYDKNEGYISTSTIYSQNGGNPVAWALQSAAAPPPTNARLAKLVITGGAQNNVLGTVLFDDVEVLLFGTGAFNRKVEFNAPGTYVWRCPADVYLARITAVGAGGGGACDGTRQGGGAGGTGIKYVSLTPGTDYDVVVGAKGIGGVGAGAPGTDGTDSSFETNVVVGLNGVGGHTDSTGGQGGSGTGDEVYAGESGFDSVNDDYRGGSSFGGGGGGFGGGGAGGTGTGGDGNHPGGGGGGSGVNEVTGGDGADGKVIIEFP